MIFRLIIMVLSKIVCGFILTTCFLLVNSELFSSVSDFQKLVNVESEFIEDLKTFIVAQKKNIEFLERKLEIFEKENEEATRDPIKYVSNPLNAFLLTQRLSSEIVVIESSSWDCHKSFSNAIDQLYNSSLMASINDDKTGVVRAIAHLQMVYTLETKDLVKGIIKGKPYREPLTVRNILEIGSIMTNLTECEKSKEWLKEALLLIEIEQIPEFERNEIYQFIAFNLIKCNFVHEAKEIHSLITNVNERDIIEFNENVEKVVISPEKPTRLDELYVKVCNESTEIQQLSNPGLNCFFVDNSTVSKLFRFKAEIVNIDPPVYIFHDVISDEEITELKSISQDSLSRAETTIGFSESAAANNRTAKLVWFGDNDNALIEKLSRRTELLTGLTTDTSELLQVQNYGIGGYYEYHTDYLDGFWSDPEFGDRIATFMFYLTDVELGGGTAFLDLNLLVKPQKGSAVFWYNLHKSLMPDKRTTHAACPVLIGNKWVANKWIRSNGQIFRRPCDLQNDEAISEMD